MSYSKIDFMLAEFSNMQFYTKYAVLRPLCAVPERKREICANYIVYLLRQTLCNVECCLYIISNKYGYKDMPSSVLAFHVRVVYAYMNQGLFLNTVPTRKIYSSKSSFENSVC